LVLAGLGARVGYGVPLGPFGFELGGGGRVGTARVSAVAAPDVDATVASVTGAWAAPFAFLGFDAPLSSSFRIGLDAEFGYVVLPVRGRIESGDDVEVDELWTSLTLGVAVEL
jgi:hypothetical protein